MSELKIIQYLLKYSPSADWILNESGIPFLPINLNVPMDDILKEWNQISDQAVLHRSDDYYKSFKNTNNSGWKSLTIYGVNKHETQLTNSNMNWTSIAEQCPITKQWLMDSFEITSSTGRIRFMLLEPNGFILPHKDRENAKLFEVNIAITNPLGCIFRFKEYGTVPFQSGSACIMDISKEHFVINNSPEPRLHIIAHARLKNKNLVKESYADRYYC